MTCWDLSNVKMDSPIFEILCNERIYQIEESQPFMLPSSRTGSTTTLFTNNTVKNSDKSHGPTSSESELLCLNSETQTIDSPRSRAQVAPNKEDEINAIAALIVAVIRGRPKMRLDEICKLEVRRLCKSQKQKFQTYLIEINKFKPSPPPDELEALLQTFLHKTYNLPFTLCASQILVAKSIYYNFAQRRQDDSLGVTEQEKIKNTRLGFCARGTKKEAYNFFQSDVTQAAIYPVFVGGLMEAANQLPERGLFGKTKQVLVSFLHLLNQQMSQE